MKRQGSTELPRFAVGALAIAGASAANGATVQITFTGSFISTTGGNNLVTDYGGDGVSDFAGGYVGHSGWIGAGSNLFAAAYGTASGAGGFARVSVGGQSAFDADTAGVRVVSASRRELVEVQFTDSNIRGGAATTGYLDITASATQPGEKIITVMRLIFDDVTGDTIGGLNATDAAFTEYTLSAVPEPGSNLALLALGAGGLTLRRRLKRAA